MARYTQQQLDRLNEMISLGVTKAKYGDKEFEYRSLEQMRSLRDEMELDLGIKKPNSGRTYATFDKGVY